MSQFENQQNSDWNHSKHHHSKKKQDNKKTSPALIVLFVILGLLLVVLAAAIVVFFSYYSKTNYETTAASEEIQTIPEVAETMETMEATEEAAVAEELRKAKEKVRKERAEKETENEHDKQKPVYNLLLIGVDRRDASWNGNSDAMILCSVDYNEKTVTLTSFMRDTAVSIPNAGVRKLNASYALGGASLLIQTLKENFDVDVDNYAWTDFDGLKSVITTLGGVDITLTPQEAANLGYTLESDKSVHLDGDKALRYARDRHSGGYDYQRTKRQRNVIMAIVNKAKQGSLGDLSDAANAVLPYINHNIDSMKLLSLLMDLPEIREFTFDELRIPIDGLYYSQNEFLVPDYAKTIEALWDVTH